MHPFVKRFLLVAAIVFLCLVGALAAGIGVYRLGEDHIQPVPGRPSPSTSNR